jgi:hypothetical protein
MVALIIALSRVIAGGHGLGLRRARQSRRRGEHHSIAVKCRLIAESMN